MTSPPAIAAMIAAGQGPTPRIAVVTAVQAGPPMRIEVAFLEGGDSFAPAVLAQPSLPAVGSKALVLPAGTAWVYLGPVHDPDTPDPFWTREARVRVSWAKGRNPAGTWFQSRSSADDQYPLTRFSIPQGPMRAQQGDPDTDPTLNPVNVWQGLFWNDMQAEIARVESAGGTVHQVELVLERDVHELEGPAPFISPVLFGHAYDGVSDPVATSSATWVPGFNTGLRLAPIGRGEVARWALAAEWVDALRTGVIKGLGLYSEAPLDGMFTGSYSSPDMGRNGALVITYSAPAEVID